jgi:hypothetical protein
LVIVYEAMGEDRGEAASSTEPAQHPLFAESHALLRATSDLIKAARANFEALDREHPELTGAWKKELRTVYERLCAEPDRG